MAIINPYEQINWDTVQKVQSMSHEHYYHIGTSQEAIDHLYSKSFRHFAFSEYQRERPLDDENFPEDTYGSAPMYPLSRWHNNLPSDIIASPNAEHVGGSHTITMGSLAGTIGHRCSRFGLSTPCTPDNARAVWDLNADAKIDLTDDEFHDYALNGMPDPNGEGSIGGMQYADGGGIYFAHSGSMGVIDYLDKDPRFLGSDMYSDRRDPADETQLLPTRGYQIEQWDAVLATGRRFWAFAESDRGRFGCNILLLPEFTEHEALRAYRYGNFYCKMAFGDTGLKFKKIQDHGNRVEVETEGADNGIRIISEKGVVATSSGNTLEYIYPTKGGQVDMTFLRVEARGPNFTDTELDDRDWPPPNYDSGVRYDDEIYSQALLFRNKEQVAGIVRKARNKKYFAAGLI